MKIKFEFKSGILESDFITDSFELTEIYFNNLEPTDNSVRLKIPFNIEIANKLKTFKEDIRVRVVNVDNTNLFTGYLRNDFNFTKTQRNEPIQIEIISPSFLLDKDLKEPVTEFKKTVNEIIKILLQKAGFENIPDTGINNILDVFIAKDGDNIKEILTNLCFEFGYVFNFDKDGLFKLYPLFNIPETQNIVQTFDGTNILESVTMNKKEQEADNIHAEWSRIDFKNNTLIFSDTQNGTDTDKCNIKIAPNSFVFDKEENYIKYDSTLGEILCVKALSRIDVIVDSGIQYTIKNLGKQGLFKAKNYTGTEKLIRKFDVYGNAYIKTVSNVTKSSRGNKIKKVELSYLNTKESIESFVKNLQAYYEYADFTLTLKSKMDYAIGSFVKVFENGIGTIYARIIEKKRRYKEAYQYKLEAISEYTPTKIKTIGNISSSKEIIEKKSIPPIPQNISCNAYKDGIKINWNVETQGLENAIDYFFIEIKKNDNNNVTFQTSNTEFFYHFNRTIDGYPEKDNLLNWKIKIKSKSIQNLESEFSEEKNVNLNNYGTWTLVPPTVNNLTSDRTVILQIQEGFRSDNLTQYGKANYKIQITRPDVDNNNWYSPSTNLNPYESEINYKNKLNEFITTGNVYSQTLPLKGQDTNTIENTLYQFKIIATNESGNVSESVIINATALCTSLRDIVKAKTNFKEIYVPELSAISANLGSISEGSLTSNNHNYWALTDTIINNVFKKKGSFKVGDDNQYLQVEYKEDGKAGVSVKSGSFFLESAISEFTGNLIVFDNDNKNNRVKIISNGIYFEEKINNIWQSRGQFILDSNGNIVISNGKNTPKLGNPITDSQTVYHFNTNINDSEGGNKENINCEGNIISDDAPVSSNCFNGDITVNLTDGKQILFFNTGGYLQVGKNKGGIMVSLNDNLEKIKTPVHDFYNLYGGYFNPSQVSIRHNIIKKGTINPPQDVHTIEVMNVVEYLRNLPQNTTTNPYKIKLLYNGRNIKTYELIRGMEVRWRVQGIIGSTDSTEFMTTRFVDFSYTDIEVDDYIRKQGAIYNSNYYLSRVFSYGDNLIKSPRFINPKNVRNLDFRSVFFDCRNLIEAYFPPNGVIDMYEMFKHCSKLQSINLTGFKDDITNLYVNESFPNCPSLTDIYYDFEVEEKTWSLYSLKRTGTSVILKKYNLANNTLINEKVIDCGNCDYPVTLFYRTDELLIDRNGNVTDRQIELLLKNKLEFGDKYTLDPAKKWLVVWADNPDNVRSNCFVTQKELQELKTKLKTYHPDLI